jgi:hypothetical protein
MLLLCPGSVSRDECVVLNDILLHKSPPGCYSMSHNSGEDKFTYPNDSPFVGDDAKQHRNSWLMPKLARRLTKDSKYHVSNWRQPVAIDAEQCAGLRKQLEEKMNKSEVASKMPEACVNA